MVDENENEARTSARRRVANSMLVPVILITAGILVLLSNLNFLPLPNWQAAVRLWPLLLIFIGLDFIVRQVRRPFGTWLSLLTSLLCAAVFAFILIFSGQSPTLAQLHEFLEVKSNHESISFPASVISEAKIEIKFSTANAQVDSLDDSRNMLEADVSYLDKLIYETNIIDGKVEIILDTDDDGGWLSWLNPSSWIIDDVNEQWTIALSQAVPIDLDLDLHTGSVNLDLLDLNLTNLAIDGGAGIAQLMLPGGDYDMAYDVESGPVEITLPPDGQHIFSIDGGEGSLTITIPSSLHARLVIDSASGRLRINTDRLTRVEPTDDAVWESYGFVKADDKVDLLIDPGSGDIIIQEQ